MKVLIVLAAAFALASAATINLNAGHKRTIINGLQREIVRRIHGLGPDALLPPIDDPLVLNETHFNFDELEQELASGELHIHEGHADGLSTLTDTFELNLITFTLQGDLLVDRAAIQLAISANAIIHLPFSDVDRALTAAVGATFQGSVESFHLEKVYAKLHVNLITDRATVSDLDATVHFNGAIHVEGKGVEWDHVEPDWEAVNADLPDFIADLIATEREKILLLATDIINLILKDLPISEIIGGIGK